MMAAAHTETREQRQALIDARVAELRARAAAKQATAERIYAASNQDGAFWTQPAYGNAAGRAFARHRDRERGRLMKAAELAINAKALSDRADVMEKRGAVMAGDARADTDSAVAACKIAVGQIADTVHFGARRVLKVNAKTILVEGAFGPLKIEKQYVTGVRT